MKRRGLLPSAAAILAMPRIARSQDARTLRFVPQVALPLLNPVTNSAYMTRNHGFAVFDSFQGRMSIVLVEQYLDFEMATADRFVVLSRGNVVRQDDRGSVSREALAKYIVV